MDEKCKICGEESEIIYDGPIKYGLLAGYTEENHKVYQCKQCRTIWNHAQEELSCEFYESDEYRKRIEGSSEIDVYYTKHDKEVLDKLKITGTDIFRGKVVADLGCAGGSFGSIIFCMGFDLTSLHYCNPAAILDRPENKCCGLITDGEELRNNQLYFPVSTTA